MENRKNFIILFIFFVLFFVFALVGLYVYGQTSGVSHHPLEIECKDEFCVRSNGVGIGTTNPVQKLHVYSNVADTAGGIVRVDAGNNFRGDWYAWRSSDNKNGGVVINSYRDGTGYKSLTLEGDPIILRGVTRMYVIKESLTAVNPASLIVGRAADGWDAIRGYTDGTNSSAVIGVATGTGEYAPNYGLYSWGAVVINRYYGSQANGDISQSNLYFSGYGHGIFWGDSGPEFTRDNNLPHIEASEDGKLWVSAGADGVRFIYRPGIKMEISQNIIRKRKAKSLKEVMLFQ